MLDEFCLLVLHLLHKMSSILVRFFQGALKRVKCVLFATSVSNWEAVLIDMAPRQIVPLIKVIVKSFSSRRA